MPRIVSVVVCCALAMARPAQAQERFSAGLTIGAGSKGSSSVASASLDGAMVLARPFTLGAAVSIWGGPGTVAAFGPVLSITAGRTIVFSGGGTVVYVSGGGKPGGLGWGAGASAVVPLTSKLAIGLGVMVLHRRQERLDYLGVQLRSSF